MSAPSLTDRIAYLTADPVLAGHPVVAGLVVEDQKRELAALRTRVAAQNAELAELRRQLGRHSGNSGQLPSQDGPQAGPPAA